MATVGRGADQYTVRFPDGLRDRVKAAAAATGRSMNDLIVAALEEKYPAPLLTMEHFIATLKEVQAVSADKSLTHEEMRKVIGDLLAPFDYMDVTDPTPKPVARSIDIVPDANTRRTLSRGKPDDSDVAPSGGRSIDLPPKD